MRLVCLLSLASYLFFIRRRQPVKNKTERMNDIKKYVKTIGDNKSKSAINKVFEDEYNYYIKSPKKDVYLIIDKDDSVLEYIEKCIQEYGSLHSNTYTFEFYRKGRKNIYVSHLLLCYYQNKEYKGLIRVHYKDGNAFNCKRDNLYNQTVSDLLKLESRSVSITHNSEYIYLTERKTGLKFITYYERELLELLASPRISWTLSNTKNKKGGKDYNRLVARVTYRGKVCNGCYTSLAELVWGYYNYGIRNYNLTTALRKTKKELRQKGLVVDHLISDELNNTKANLSAIDESENSRKQSIDRKVQPPYYLIMVYKDGVYKAVYCFGYYVYPIITANDLESLLEQVKSILSKDVFGEYESALQWRKSSGINKYNLPDNYKVQKFMFDNFDNELLDVMVGEYIQTFYW